MGNSTTQAEQDAARQAPTRAPHANDAAEGPARVLLVEDDAALRRYLEVSLSRAGYAVTTAADGVEALKLALASARVSAVVTDAVMPRLGGHELCRLLRARPEFASVPLVLLTGLDADSETAGPRSLADARLTKPVGAGQLLDCLARLLDKAD